MNLMDDFLKKHNSTRYQVAKISGMSAGHLSRQSKEPIENISVRVLRALGMATGLNSYEVLEELELLNDTALKGFKKLIKKYGYSFPKLEKNLADIILELESYNVKINEFSFNRFEEENHEDMEKAIEQALKNTIEMLSKSLENIKKGLPPVPDDSYFKND